MNSYEIAVIFHPDLEIDISKSLAKVEKIITDNGGKISKMDNWGKKKLAYKIAKQDSGVYVFFTADIPPRNVQKIEATLNISSEIIRYLLTKPDLKAIAKAKALKNEKAEKASSSNDKLDENDSQE